MKEVTVTVNSDNFRAINPVTSNEKCGLGRDIHGPGSFGTPPASLDFPTAAHLKNDENKLHVYVADLETAVDEVNPNAGPTRHLQTAPYRPPGRTAFHSKQTEVFHCPAARWGRYVHLRTHADGHHHLVCEVEITVKYKRFATHSTGNSVPVHEFHVKVYPDQWTAHPTA